MSTLAAYRRLLGNGPMVRLLAGEAISSVGDWLYLVALLVIVYRETADPVLLGIVGAARVLPYILLSVPAGIVADRFDRRIILLSTDLARGAIMVLLAIVVLVEGPLLVVVLLSVAATCFSTFFGPAIGAYLPSLARDEDELGPANSAWATLDNLAFVVGPAIGGLLIAASDLAPAFVLNAVSFGIVAAILAGLPAGRPDRPAPPADDVADRGGDASLLERSRPATAESALRLEALAGTAAATDLRAAARPILGLGLVDVATGFVFGGLGVLTVVIATDRLASGEAATGFLNAAIGVGGIIGAIISGAVVLRRALGGPLLAGAVVLGVGLAALGAVTSLVPALVAMTVAATGSLVTEVVSTTIFQRVVPDALRGRALGVVTTISTLAYAAGSLLLPILAADLGYLPVLVAGGLVVIGAAAIAVILVRPALERGPAAGAATLRRVTALPLFTGVPPAAIEAAAARLRSVTVPAGTVVLREGEPAERFYLIEAGEFAVDQGSGGSRRRLRTIGQDEVFGELGLLRRAPRSATVTALVAGRLLALDGRDFLELVSAGPQLAARLLDPRRLGLAGAAAAETEDQDAAGWRPSR